MGYRVFMMRTIFIQQNVKTAEKFGKSANGTWKKVL